MKKFSMLALAGLCSMGFLSACSDDTTPDPTRAELCAQGISEDCLNGAWNVDGLADAAGSMHSLYNYAAAPGTLTFDKNTHEFQYDAPAAAAAIASSDCNPVYGEWSVVAGALHMKSFTNTMCMGPKTIDVTTAKVVASQDGSQMIFTLGQTYFMYNLTDDQSVRASHTETFSSLATATK